MVETRSMRKAKAQKKTTLVRVETPKSIIQTRAQKKREALYYHRSVLQEIANYYTDHGHEPTEQYLALYCNQMRSYHQEGRLHPDFVGLVETIIPWFEWQEKQTTDDPGAARGIDYAALLTVILFFYLMKELWRHYLGAFVNSLRV
uniref:Uncharacterized protein n=1 Tax=viral metagenome TaxID=1070528 RepID=A0A6C0DSZ5_9ZZZZ